MTTTFGALLRHLRRKNGMTQHDLAERLGYSRSLVAALETDRRLPEVDAVAKEYVAALGLDGDRDQAIRLVEAAAQSRRGTPTGGLDGADGHGNRSTYAVDRIASNIPLPPLKLFGRDREVALLSEQILERDARLLTLVGPPGVGKTRLAQALASRLEPYFADGVRIILLAGITVPDAIASMILESLEARAKASLPWASLVAYLRRKEMLLVLDNFEQILVAAPHVAELLAECPKLSILTTSRERLHLRAEHIALIKPLHADAAEALFLARASAINSDIFLGQEVRPLAQTICNRLDNLPLAIELCAAQTDYYSLEQLLEQLQIHQLDALVDGAEDLPPQQRSLRTAIASSFELLDADERDLLLALSVFAGGCAPEMAEEVWLSSRGKAALPASKVLRSLVAKNLVSLESAANGTKRLHMLESVREFSLERLESDGELAAARQRHYDVVIAFLRIADANIMSAEYVAWLKRLRQETDNMIAALQWAFDQERWSAVASHLLLFFRSFGEGPRLAEYEGWIDKLVPHIDVLDPDLQMVVKMHYLYSARGNRDQQRLYRQGYHSSVDACSNPLIKADAYIRGVDLGIDFGASFPDPLDVLRQALVHAREGRTTPQAELIFGSAYRQEVVLPSTLFHYGIQLANRGETVESATFLREALALERGAMHKFGFAYPLGFLGRIALMECREGEAIALLEEAVDAAAGIGDERATATWRAFLGQATLYSGDLIGAKRILAQAWRECSEYDDPFIRQIATIFLAELAFAEDDVDEARRWLEESIALSAQSSRDIDWRHTHRAMLAARLAAAKGNDKRAAALFGFVNAYNDRIAIGTYLMVRDTAAPEMAQVRARLGDEAYQRAFESGRLLPNEETLANLLS